MLQCIIIKIQIKLKGPWKKKIPQKKRRNKGSRWKRRPPIKEKEGSRDKILMPWAWSIGLSKLGFFKQIYFNGRSIVGPRHDRSLACFVVIGICLYHLFEKNHLAVKKLYPISENVDISSLREVPEDIGQYIPSSHEIFCYLKILIRENIEEYWMLI